MIELPHISDADSHPVAVAYRAHADLLRAIAGRRFHVPPDDVEALVNDVFVSFIRHHAHVRDPRSWLTAAMRNTCAEYWRHNGNVAFAEEAQGASVADLRRDSIAVRVDMRRVLARLSKHCRRVLFLRFYIGLSVKELAAQLGVTSNNAKQIVHRCKAAARALFVQLGGRDQ
jgi:RNA polymerase sigma factor (sigma-70 family)